MRRKAKHYRRLWYFKRNRAKIKTYIIIAIIIISLALVIIFAESRLRRSILQISEYRTKSIINHVVSKAVNESFHENINYDEIVIINRDENDRIDSIQTDIVKLNRIYAICLLTFKKSFWSFLKRKYQFLWGGIREIFICCRRTENQCQGDSTGSVETDFESEFVSAGINQTRHRIYLEVKTTVGIVVPFTDKKQK